MRNIKIIKLNGNNDFFNNEKLLKALYNILLNKHIFKIRKKLLLGNSRKIKFL